MTSNNSNITTKPIQIPVAHCCPHCKSTHFVRNGIHKDVQRYKCKTCNKTFKDTTGTPLHGLHKKAKIEKYLEALRAGLSVRKAAKYVGIATSTAFEWRHKLLSSLNMRPQVQEQETVAGIAIIRKPYSAKGRQKEPEKYTLPSKSIVIISDRNIIITKLKDFKTGKDASKSIKSFIYKGYFAAVPDKLLRNAIRKTANVTPIRSQKQSLLYKNKASFFISAIEDWMDKFRGVASKYLQNYWSWYVALKRAEPLKNEVGSFNEWAVMSRSLSSYRKNLAQ